MAIFFSISGADERPRIISAGTWRRYGKGVKKAIFWSHSGNSEMGIIMPEKMDMMAKYMKIMRLALTIQKAVMPIAIFMRDAMQ